MSPIMTLHRHMSDIKLFYQRVRLDCFNAPPGLVSSYKYSLYLVTSIVEDPIARIIVPLCRKLIFYKIFKIKNLDSDNRLNLNLSSCKPNSTHTQCHLICTMYTFMNNSRSPLNSSFIFIPLIHTKYLI